MTNQSFLTYNDVAEIRTRLCTEELTRDELLAIATRLGDALSLTFETVIPANNLDEDQTP